MKDAEANKKRKSKEKKKKQAVILIHGIGEQRPMDTLRGFVKAVWEKDTSIHHSYANYGLFSKRDAYSEGFDVRRLTSTKNKNDVRTDFFEYYWAHLLEGTKVSHVLRWAKRLIFRNPRKLPKRLQPVWLLSIFVILIGLFLFFGLPQIGAFEGALELTIALGIAGYLLLQTIIWFTENVIGDAARYLHPDPRNIKSRNEIRRKGVELLMRLSNSKEYDRIILVGHSLGSIIAYDILTSAWVQYETSRKQTDHCDALTALETMAKEGITDIDNFQNLQKKAFKEATELGSEWLVSDLVTIGSPLTYANVLLGNSKKAFRLKKEQRELPTVPPQAEKDDSFQYQYENKIHLHEAAMFALTKWTNLYFPSSFVLWGDIIGGPIAPQLGPGIKDVSVNIDGKTKFFAHSSYWKMKKSKKEKTKDDSKTPPKTKAVESHIVAFREAINLLNE